MATKSKDFAEKLSEAEERLRLLQTTVPVKVTEQRIEANVQQAEAMLEKLKKFTMSNSTYIFKRAASEETDVFTLALEDLNFITKPADSLLAAAYDKTAELLRHGQTLYGESQQLLEAGQALEREGKTDEAKAKYDEAMKKYQEANVLFKQADYLAYALVVYDELEGPMAKSKDTKDLDFLVAFKNGIQNYAENVGQNNFNEHAAFLVMQAGFTYYDFRVGNLNEQAQIARDFTIPILNRGADQLGVMDEQIAIIRAMGTDVPDSYKQRFLEHMKTALSMFEIDSHKTREETEQQLNNAALFTAAALQLAAYSTMPSELKRRLKEDAAELETALRTGALTNELLAEKGNNLYNASLEDVIKTLEGYSASLKLPKPIRDTLDQSFANMRQLLEEGNVDRVFQAIRYLTTYRTAVLSDAPFARNELIEAVALLCKPGELDGKQLAALDARLQPELAKLSAYVQFYQQVKAREQFAIERNENFAELEKKFNELGMYNVTRIKNALAAVLGKARLGQFNEAEELLGAAAGIITEEDQKAVRMANELQRMEFVAAINQDVANLEEYKKSIGEYIKQLEEKKKHLKSTKVGREIEHGIDLIIKRLEGLQESVDDQITALNALKDEKDLKTGIDKRTAIFAEGSKFDVTQGEFQKIVRYATVCLDQLGFLENYYKLAVDAGTRNDQQIVIGAAGIIQNAIESIGKEDYRTARARLEESLKSLYSLAAYKADGNTFFIKFALPKKLEIIDSTLNGIYATQAAEANGAHIGLAFIDANINQALEAALTEEHRDGKLFEVLKQNIAIMSDMVSNSLGKKSERSAKLNTVAFEQCFESFELQLQAFAERNADALTMTTKSLQALAKIPEATEANQTGFLRIGLDHQTSALRAFVKEKMDKGNENHPLFTRMVGNVAFLTDHNYQLIMDRLEGRYAGAKMVLAPSSFLASNIDDVKKAATSLESGWFIAGEADKQKQLFTALLDSMGTQRALIEESIKLAKAGGQMTSERYEELSRNMVVGALKRQLQIAERQGDTEIVARLQRNLNDLQKANLKLAHHIIELVGQTQLAELTRNFSRDMVDLVGGLLPGYGTITEYARTGTVHAATLGFDIVSIVPVAGQLARAGRAAKAGFAATRTSLRMGATGFRALAEGRAAYRGIKFATFAELGMFGNAAHALDVTERAFIFTGLGAGVVYGGYTIGSEHMRARTLDESMRWEAVTGSLQSLLPLGGMLLGGGAARLARTAQGSLKSRIGLFFVRERSSPLMLLDRFAHSRFAYQAKVGWTRTTLRAADETGAVGDISGLTTPRRVALIDQKVREIRARMEKAKPNIDAEIDFRIIRVYESEIPKVDALLREAKRANDPRLVQELDTMLTELQRQKAGLEFTRDQYTAYLGSLALQGVGSSNVSVVRSAVRTLAAEQIDPVKLKQKVLADLRMKNPGTEFLRLVDQHIELEISIRKAAKDGNLVEVRAYAAKLEDNLRLLQQEAFKLDARVEVGVAEPTIKVVRPVVEAAEPIAKKPKVEPVLSREEQLLRAATKKGMPPPEQLPIFDRKSLENAKRRYGEEDLKLIVRGVLSHGITEEPLSRVSTEGSLTHEEWTIFLAMPEQARLEGIAAVLNRSYSDRAGFKPEAGEPGVVKHGERKASQRKRAVKALKTMEAQLRADLNMPDLRLVDERLISLHETQRMYYDIGSEEHTQAFERVYQSELYGKLDPRLKARIYEPHNGNYPDPQTGRVHVPDGVVDGAQYVDYKLLAMLADQQAFMAAVDGFAPGATIDNVSYLGAGCFNVALKVDVTLPDGTKKSIVVRGPADPASDIAASRLLKAAGVKTFDMSDVIRGKDATGKDTYLSVQEFVSGKSLETVLTEIGETIPGTRTETEAWVRRIESVVGGYFDNLAVAHFFGLLDHHTGNFRVMPDGSFMRLDFGMHMEYGFTKNYGNEIINIMAKDFVESFAAYTGQPFDARLVAVARKAFAERWKALQAKRGEVETAMLDMQGKGELVSGSGDNSGSQDFDLDGKQVGRNALRVLGENDIGMFRQVADMEPDAVLEGVPKVGRAAEVPEAAAMEPTAPARPKAKEKPVVKPQLKPEEAFAPTASAPKVVPTVTAPEATAVRVQHNVDMLYSKQFRKVAGTESIGGNAGAARLAVNMFVDENGKIVAIGNIQHLDQKLIEGKGQITLRQQFLTGIITDIFGLEHLSPTARKAVEAAVFEYNKKAIAEAPAKVEEMRKYLPRLKFDTAEPYGATKPKAEEAAFAPTAPVAATAVKPTVPAHATLYGEGLGVIRKGERVIVFDGAYLLGKHGAGGEVAGSKLGDVATPEQLLALLQERLNLDNVTGNRVVIPNVPLGQRVGNDSLVKVLAIKQGDVDIPVGTPLQRNVEYKVKVRDQSGAEFEATMKLEVTRSASPDGKTPEIVQPVIYSDRALPATDKVNVVLMKVDLNDPRAAWINKDALVQKAGSIEGSEVYAVLTVFPGEYAPDAGVRRAELDPAVGMTGDEFWNGHALMRKPPEAVVAEPKQEKVSIKTIREGEVAAAPENPKLVFQRKVEADAVQHLVGDTTEGVALRRDFVSGIGELEGLDLSQTEVAAIGGDLQQALRAEPRIVDGNQRFEHGNIVLEKLPMTLREGEFYPGIYKVKIKTSKGEVTAFYKARDFREQVLGIWMRDLVGVEGPPAFLLPDGTVLQKAVPGQNLGERLRTETSPASRQAILRDVAEQAIVDFGLGIPDCNVDNFRVTPDGRILRIDFENAGIGWGYGIRSSFDQRDHIRFWDALHEHGNYTPGDLRAFLDGIKKGFERLRTADADGIVRIAEAAEGLELARGKKLERTHVDQLKERLQKIKDSPEAERHKMLDYLLRYIWKRAEQDMPALAKDCREIFPELLRDAPAETLNQWKTYLASVKKSKAPKGASAEDVAKVEKTRAWARDAFDIVEKEIKRRT